jgi:hypothetical protein
MEAFRMKGIFFPIVFAMLFASCATTDKFELDYAEYTDIIELLTNVPKYPLVENKKREGKLTEKSIHLFVENGTDLIPVVLFEANCNEGTEYTITANGYSVPFGMTREMLLPVIIVMDQEYNAVETALIENTYQRPGFATSESWLRKYTFTPEKTGTYIIMLSPDLKGDIVAAKINYYNQYGAYMGTATIEKTKYEEYALTIKSPSAD